MPADHIAPIYHQFCRYLYIYYLPSGLFVVVSWTSFLIPPEIIPGRMALLVTLGRHSIRFDSNWV